MKFCSYNHIERLFKNEGIANAFCWSSMAFRFSIPPITNCIECNTVTSISITNAHPRSRLLDFLSRPEALGTAVGLDASTEDKEDKKLEEEEASSEEKDAQKHILRFTNASFSWHHSSPPVLRDLNFSLPAGQVTMVIGQFSCIWFFWSSLAFQEAPAVARALCCQLF